MGGGWGGYLLYRLLHDLTENSCYQRLRQRYFSFIQKDSRYSEHVPTILGTLHIKDVIQSATKEELTKLGEVCEVGTLGSFVLARIAQLEKTPIIHQVDHYVRLTRNETSAPMQVKKNGGNC